MDTGATPTERTCADPLSGGPVGELCGPVAGKSHFQYLKTASLLVENYVIIVARRLGKHGSVYCLISLDTL